MTDKQIKLADAIVNNFKERDGITTHAPSIMSILGETGFHKNDVTYVIKILENKNILAPTKMDFDVVFLTDKGWAYTSYNDLLIDEKRKYDLEEAVLNSSVLANNSVSKVNSLFWVIAIFAILSAIGTLGSFILQLLIELRKP